MTCRVRPSPKRGNAVLQKKGNRRLHFFHLSFHTFFTPFATSIDPHHITKNTHAIHRQRIGHGIFVFSNLNLPVFYELFEFKLSPWLLWIVQMFCEFSCIFFCLPCEFSLFDNLMCDFRLPLSQWKHIISFNWPMWPMQLELCAECRHGLMIRKHVSRVPQINHRSGAVCSISLNKIPLEPRMKKINCLIIDRVAY